MPPVVKKVNRYVDMTPDREKKIDELLDMVTKHFNPLPEQLQLAIKYTPTDPEPRTVDNPKRLYAYMFLHSREWDLKKAFAMAQVVCEYRRQNNLDDLRRLPSAFSLRGFDEQAIMEHYEQKPREQPARYDKVCEAVDRHFDAGLHYWDKEGLPVMYMMIGTVDEPGLLKALKQTASIGNTADDVIWEYTQHAISVGEMVAMYLQHMADSGELKKEGVDSTGGAIRSCTVVVDVSGLTYKMLWKPALDLFQHDMIKMFQYYPDCVSRIVVVNAPAMVMFAYSIVKGTLNEQVQRKISFYNVKDSFAALEQVIDKKHIPKFLGGECQCPGNCIRSYNPEDPKKKLENQGGGDAAADVVTESIVLKPGKVHEKLFRMRSGNRVHWDFALEHGKDVTFSIFFIPSTEQESEAEKVSEKRHEKFLVSKNQPTSGTDSFLAEKDGTLALVWDNKSSWVKSKTVQMRVFMEAEDGILNSKSVLVPASSSGNYPPRSAGDEKSKSHSVTHASHAHESAATSTHHSHATNE